MSHQELENEPLLYILRFGDVKPAFFQSHIDVQKVFLKHSRRIE